MTLAFWTKKFWRQDILWKDKNKEKTHSKRIRIGSKKGGFITTAYKPCPACGHIKSRERGKGDNYYYKCLKCGNKFK